MRDFNPRSPYGERLSTPDIVRIAYPISIHAPLTGSDDLAINSAMDAVISIHAPLTGSDHRVQPVDRLPADFNPRSPYGERPSTNVALNSANAFQSTLPLRGATCARSGYRFTRRYFNPRSPYGERLPGIMARATAAVFQSTLPLRGATYRTERDGANAGFQSTLPLRGATHFDLFANADNVISIHASLTGSDLYAEMLADGKKFQSTLPLRGATRCGLIWAKNRSFQSTLPLRGATVKTKTKAKVILFQSTLPLRGATRYQTHDRSYNKFQSTLPLRGATFFPTKTRNPFRISIHASLTGSDDIL